MHSNASPGNGPADRHDVAVDRCRQDGPAVVVRVVAEDLDAAWGDPARNRPAAETRPERRGGLADQLAW
jgi:hypothetical protein